MYEYVLTTQQHLYFGNNNSNNRDVAGGVLSAPPLSKLSLSLAHFIYSLLSVLMPRFTLSSSHTAENAAAFCFFLTPQKKKKKKKNKYVTKAGNTLSEGQRQVDELQRSCKYAMRKFYSHLLLLLFTTFLQLLRCRRHSRSRSRIRSFLLLSSMRRSRRTSVIKTNVNAVWPAAVTANTTTTTKTTTMR